MGIFDQKCLGSVKKPDVGGSVVGFECIIAIQAPFKTSWEYISSILRQLGVFRHIYGGIWWKIEIPPYDAVDSIYGIFSTKNGRVRWKTLMWVGPWSSFECVIAIPVQFSTPWEYIWSILRPLEVFRLVYIGSCAKSGNMQNSKKIGKIGHFWPKMSGFGEKPWCGWVSGRALSV